MKKQIWIILMITLGISIFSYADVSADQASVYYVGKQATFLGEVDCYVEATYSEDGLAVSVRSLITDGHTNEMIGLGPLEADYVSSDAKYVFYDQKAEDVISMELISKIVKQGETLDLVLNHGSHAHGETCASLIEATQKQLSDVKEMFHDFDQFIEDHVHQDEDHGNEDVSGHNEDHEDHDHAHEH